MKIKSNWTPLIIALVIGLVAAAYYVWSGKSSFDLNMRGLAGQGNVAQVMAGDAKNISVKCKNGENYEISFKEDQGNYANLVFNACGPEGTQE